MSFFFRVPVVASALALAMLAAPAAHAQQVVSPDFANQVQTTLPSNEQLLGQIQDTLPSTNLSTLSSQTADSVSTGQALMDELNAAFNLAPDDATRSRIQALINHTQSALDSLQMAQSATSLDAARGRLDEARGEVQESLNELQPFVLGLVASGAITGK